LVAAGLEEREENEGNPVCGKGLWPLSDWEEKKGLQKGPFLTLGCFQKAHSLTPFKYGGGGHLLRVYV